jgi:hypothetical protein
MTVVSQAVASRAVGGSRFKLLVEPAVDLVQTVAQPPRFGVPLLDDGLVVAGSRELPWVDLGEVLANRLFQLVRALRVVGADALVGPGLALVVAI